MAGLRLRQAYEMAALARMRPVLGPDATLADLGSRHEVRTRTCWAIKLLLPRSIGHGVSIQGTTTMSFDLATTGVDGPPLYRRSAKPGSATVGECAR